MAAWCSTWVVRTSVYSERVSLTNDTTAAWTISKTTANTNAPGSSTFKTTNTQIATGTVTSLGLSKGKTYEIAVFHADQHPRESNYELTLTGFSTKRTDCAPFCGDGVMTGGEECDLGTNGQGDPQCNAGSGCTCDLSTCTDTLGNACCNMTGAYNGCNADCTYGPFCGDGTVNGNEQCDQGNKNGATYGKDGCTGDCRTPHYCGDGIIDGLDGEECDPPASGTCDTSCKVILGPVN